MLDRESICAVTDGLVIVAPEGLRALIWVWTEPIWAVILSLWVFTWAAT